MEEFYKVIEQDTPVFVYFYTKWCPDCFAIKVHLPRLEKEFENVLFYSFDRDVDIELAKHLEIFGIPSFLMFQKETEIGRFVSKNKKTYQEVYDFIQSNI
jgi:thiol-disulfide isomerase/thioredoxin